MKIKRIITNKYFLLEVCLCTSLFVFSEIIKKYSNYNDIRVVDVPTMIPEGVIYTIGESNDIRRCKLYRVCNNSTTKNK